MTSIIAPIAELLDDDRYPADPVVLQRRDESELDVHPDLQHQHLVHREERVVVAVHGHLGAFDR